MSIIFQNNQKCHNTCMSWRVCKCFRENHPRLIFTAGPVIQPCLYLFCCCGCKENQTLACAVMLTSFYNNNWQLLILNHVWWFRFELGFYENPPLFSNFIFLSTRKKTTKCVLSFLSIPFCLLAWVFTREQCFQVIGLKITRVQLGILVSCARDRASVTTTRISMLRTQRFLILFLQKPMKKTE